MENENTVVVVKRPSDTKLGPYLYNIILKKEQWEKVTLLLRDPNQQILDRLREKGIDHYIFRNGSLEHSVNDPSPLKKLVEELSDALSYLDGVLSNVLTDEQVESLDMERIENIAALLERTRSG